MDDINKKISTDAPRELSAIQGVVSYNDAIEDVRQVQIPPREQSIFGYDENNIVSAASTPSNVLRYLISDGAYYLDMASTYIDCEFKAQAQIPNAPGPDVVLTEKYLDNGGLHAAVKSVRVSVGGMDLCYINEYAKWYNACVNLTKNSREYRDRVLFTEGDSSQDGVMKDSSRVPLTNTGGTYVVADNLLTLTGGAATTELQVGDEIEITAANVVYRSNVIRIEDDEKVIVDLGNVAIAAVLSAHRVSRSYPSTRRFLVDGQTHRVAFHLPLPLFEIQEYMPLPLLQGMGPMEVQIEFHRASQFLVVSPAAAENKLGYVLSNPRMNCKMIRPVRDIIEAHKSLAKSSGFMLYYRDFRHFPISLTGGSANYNLQIQTNLNSVHNIISVMVDQKRADSDDATSQNYLCQSSFLRDSLKLYRYTLGGRQYPNFDYVRMDNGGNADSLAAQAYKQLEMVLGVDVKYTTPSIEPFQWRSSSSDKFIISTTMSKYANYNCGVQASNTAIEIDLQKQTGNASNQVLHNFLHHDTLAVIGDNKLNIFR